MIWTQNWWRPLLRKTTTIRRPSCLWWTKSRKKESSWRRARIQEHTFKLIRIIYKIRSRILKQRTPFNSKVPEMSSTILSGKLEKACVEGLRHLKKRRLLQKPRKTAECSMFIDDLFLGSDPLADVYPEQNSTKRLKTQD